MKVAIFIKNNELTVLHEENVHVIIFNLKDDKVIGVKNIVLEKQTNDSIVYWLILNSINQIYISEINDQTLQRVKSKGRIISIVTEGDNTVKNLSHFAIEVPNTEECLAPLLSVVPLQLLAYHIAVEKGCNVDQPRNLAKSVTVE